MKIVFTPSIDELALDVCFFELYNAVYIAYVPESFSFLALFRLIFHFGVFSVGKFVPIATFFFNRGFFASWINVHDFSLQFICA